MKNIIILFVSFLFVNTADCLESNSAAFSTEDENAESIANDKAEGAEKPENKFSDDALDIYQELNKALNLGELSASSKEEILDNFAPALVGQWSYFAIDNAVLEDSKFINNPVKIYDLTIANEQRIYNVSFTYFPKEKQIYFTRKEYINSSAENVILALDEAKKDDELILKFESAATHFFERENYADYLTVKIADVSGMISYVNSGIINVNVKAKQKQDKNKETKNQEKTESSESGDTVFDKANDADIKEEVDIKR